ncbi:heavy metal resistance protein CzcA [Enemella evansiae]|uniref:DEAD/DEAH box helicase n=1 Tax=Enemella evansiae TaxID=2016499 RepID=UPI000B973594|nr:DEAD/DEAH box helicase [Enemella evansiae]OYN99960.1 heavy metal resistance protein CzcA [Enemella evansiae]
MSELLPTLQARSIQQALIDYLATTFALADVDAQDALAQFLTDPDTGIFKGPWVRIRVPFQPAEPGWETTLDWMPEGFVPHGHQAAAFTRLSSKPTGGTTDLRQPQPTLVTTGTGSGKTEAFMLPILDHVLRARSLGHQGIKALILYPMNALANDQASRLAQLISNDPRLRSVTAGLYTGESEDRTTITSEGLITNRRMLRHDPPDILLTNYKMLDQLLLRGEDQALWRDSADSLRYLVLDEFHTYDGAQGTDVAMLLRRLGLTLVAHRSNDVDEPELADRGPLGQVTPVATSATLGDGGDPHAMLDFARTVFGSAFPPESVITETRLDLGDWSARWVTSPTNPPLSPGLADLTDAVEELDQLTDPRERTRALAGQLGAAPLDDPNADELARALLSHPGVLATIDLARNATSLEDLAKVFVSRTDASGYATRWVAHLIAALSHLRGQVGRDFCSVETHLWIRELTRVDRLAVSTASYCWSDDGERVPDHGAQVSYPALYCRRCGRSGWGVFLEPTGTGISGMRDIRARHRNQEKYFRALLHAPAEADAQQTEGLYWWSPGNRELTRAAPDPDAEDFREGRVLPVLTHARADEEKATRDDCPSCQSPDTIRWLGSAIATQLSVSLSALFGAEHLDGEEKKALVFTDSVQDAAHRAGFVQSRSHTLTLRATIEDSIPRDGTTLQHLANDLVADAGRDPFRRYRLIHPEIISRKNYAAFWQQPDRLPAQVRSAVTKRLGFDLALEFGIHARFGRTLETTGTAVAAVDAGSPPLLAGIARRVLDQIELQPELDGAPITDNRLVAWLRGVLEHMRGVGAIEHPWLQRFIESDGNRWWLWGGRSREGMPAFPSGRAAPSFPRVGQPTTTRDPLLENVTSSQSWYARWAQRNLGVPAQTGAAASRLLLAELAREGILHATSTESNATVYGLEADRILVHLSTDDDLASGRTMVRCTICHDEHHTTAESIDQLDGAPCLLVRCLGRLARQSQEDNYYRRFYRHGDARRIVAREHTSLLETPTRLDYETKFKTADEVAGSPNVLVATPTLEMGIDIGTLSTVFLSSLPRTVASYLQRVGRAGRRTGNALDLTYVTGHRANLPRLNEPLSMVNGTVRPPATWLSAEEILRRQYLAHVVDRMARDDIGQLPRVATQAMANTDAEAFLQVLVGQAENEAATLLDDFLGTFENLQSGSEQKLRDWAMPSDGPGTSALAGQVHAAGNRWNREIEELERRRTTIQQALPALQQLAEMPAPATDDVTAYRSARAALSYTRKELAERRRQHWVAALEEAGLLPNYSLLDDSVTLDVVVTWIDPDTQAWQEQTASINRPSARALSEFAPGSTFYAQGMEIAIDAVDLGPEAEAVHRWAFCAECGWGTDLTTDEVARCPRCGSDTPTDAGQHLDVVELTKVSAQLQRDETIISDASDERRNSNFTMVVAPDIDRARISGEWFVRGYDFGVQYLDRLTLRWLNLGRRGSGADMTLAGDQFKAPLFRLCKGCGVLDRTSRTNNRNEHRPWCIHRGSDTEDHVTSVALSRTLNTQGVVIPLPQQVTLGDSFAIPSLTAALLLGLSEQFGGAPDHLGVTTCVAPVQHGRNPHALLIHDLVPGGTGYLADLAAPERAWSLLRRAWEIVSQCPCQNQDQLACHRCLLPYANSRDVNWTSRSAAERHLHDILTAGGGLGAEVSQAMIWPVQYQQHVPRDDGASHLEQKFYAAFRKLAESLSANVVEIPGPRGNTMRFSVPGQNATWILKPQEDVGTTRPDYVLRSDNPNIPPMAIYTDGYAFHASPANNNLADDADKRATLRDAGFFVLAVTYADVQSHLDDAPAAHPRWWSDAYASQLNRLDPMCSSQLGTLSEGPFGILRNWLTGGASNAQRAMARELPKVLLAAHLIKVEDRPAEDLARRLLDGRQTPGTLPIGWWSAPGAGLLTMRDEDSFSSWLVIDDRNAQLGTDEARSAWRDWLALSNALQLSEASVAITTFSRLTVEAPATDQPLRAPEAPEWAAAFDNCVDDNERALVIALAERDSPLAVMGWEGSDDGIPIEFAWPDQQVAVVFDTDHGDALRRQGWVVLAADADEIVNVLSGEQP